ncbi:MAG TPA: KUP/HAK/KT family potassium transporter [Verrucomicrobiae bacterium]|nr:KUP/HAK/KT family potassium transporter [Verrucomicrobiae bacterium]
MSSKNGKRLVNNSSLAALGLSALGVVFGDIGTSPLYTLKTVLALTGGKPDRAVILGTLSLVIWTLIIVTTIKYVSFAMRIDNDGEGGILALMSLLGVKLRRRPVIVAIGLLGAALIYGDGAVTPAISVLSAVEGLNIVAPSLGRYVLPLAVVILLALFFIQSQGTARIGKAFGPIMLLWFVTIALLGIWGIVRNPSVLLAINPVYGISFLLRNGAKGFFALGGIFLCVTGAEALYADMGHFGARPIRLSWLALVFPSLVLNYAGQAALVLQGAPTSENIFYRLCPSAMLVPLVMLATIATIIASQSIITGTFTMTRQAIQLGWMPRIKVTQTSAEEYGQIYVGPVNWMLMIATCGLAVGFRKSDNLAAAYGIAVSATMLATSVLLFIAMREIWKWGAVRAGLIAGIFMAVDGAFFAANSTKITSGGYVPLILAGFVYGIMLIWHRGARAVAEELQKWVLPIGEFTKEISTRKIPRVPGTAVYLTRTRHDASPVMVWNLEHNRALHERLFALTVDTDSVPWVSESRRLKMTKVAPHFWRASALYGFMERPDIPALLKQAHGRGCGIDLSDVTYYVGYENIVPREGRKGLPKWVVASFAAMQRNSMHLSDYFRLPREALVEIGRQIAI